MEQLSNVSIMLTTHISHLSHVWSSLLEEFGRTAGVKVPAVHRSKFLQVMKAKRQAGPPAGTKSFLTSSTSLGFNRVTGSEQDVIWENSLSTSPTPASKMTSSVLLFDVQRQGGWRHQPAAATAACHHSDTATIVSVEASSCTTIGDGRRRGGGCGGGRLLELLLVDFALLGPAVLEPDLHLEQKKSFFYSYENDMFSAT